MITRQGPDFFGIFHPKLNIFEKCDIITASMHCKSHILIRYSSILFEQCVILLEQTPNSAVSITIKKTETDVF